MIAFNTQCYLRPVSILMLQITIHILSLDLNGNHSVSRHFLTIHKSTTTISCWLGLKSFTYKKNVVNRYTSGSHDNVTYLKSKTKISFDDGWTAKGNNYTYVIVICKVMFLYHLFQYIVLLVKIFVWLILKSITSEHFHFSLSFSFSKFVFCKTPFIWISHSIVFKIGTLSSYHW